MFTEIERPHRLAATMSMFQGNRIVESRLTTTFELRDGKTLLTLVQSDFETEEERDANLSGAAPFLDSLQRVVSRRAAS